MLLQLLMKNGDEHTKLTKHSRLFISEPCKERTKGYPMNSLIYNEKECRYLAQNYNKETILTKNKYGQEEFEFIKKVLIDS